MITILAAAIVFGSVGPIARADEVDKNNETFESLMIAESCVVKTSWERSSSSLSPEVIEALLQSSGVWGTALRETFGEDLSRIHDNASVGFETLNIDTVKQGQGEMLMTVVARLVIEVENDASTDAIKAIGGDARPLLKRVCELLEQSIIKFAESTIQEQHQQLAQFKAELDQARGQLHRIRSERRAFLDQNQVSDLTHRNLINVLDGLERDRSKMEMDRFVSRARRDAMQEQIARLSQAAKAEPIKRNDLEQFRKIVAIRQEALQHSKDLAEQDLASKGELDAMKIEVAQAEADLARAQQDAEREHAQRMHESGAGFIVEMNHELTKIAIDDADLEAKYTATIERIEKTKAALKVAEEYEQLGGPRLDIARDRLEMVQRNLADLERRISTNKRPTMTVIGAD
jgi:hypothetical protein